MGNQGPSPVDRQAPKGTAVSSFHSRTPRTTVWMTFQPDPGMSWWPMPHSPEVFKARLDRANLSNPSHSMILRSENIKLWFPFQTSYATVDLLCVLETGFKGSSVTPWEGGLLNASEDFMVCVWRLSSCLCCCGAAGNNSMISQPVPRANLSLCLPFNSQISSAWVVEMRQPMLYLMTYLMAHFPEVMRT